MQTKPLEIVHEETLCCGSRRCPTVRIFEDGSAVIADDDPEIESVGKIKLTSEAFDRLVELRTQLKR